MNKTNRPNPNSRDSDPESRHEPLAYLAERFEQDAETLRKRAAAPALSKGPRQGLARGPDAEASGRMAKACDDVLVRLRALVPDTHSATSADAALRALDTLGQRLAQQATQQPDAWVRSVYGGAATRIGDVVARTRAAWERAESEGDDDVEGDDVDDDDVDGDDDVDVDDDDVEGDDDVDDDDDDDERDVQ